MNREYYERFAGDLDEKAYHSDIYVQKFWQRNKITSIMEHVGEGELILDLGAGSGVLSATAAGKNVVVPFDLSIRCIKNCLKSSLFPGGVVGDGVELPFKDGAFDRVLCVELIEHMENPGRCVEEICRVLKKDGSLILTTPHYHILWPLAEYLWDVFGRGRDYRTQHVSKFNIASITKLLEDKGFVVESNQTIFLYTPFTALISKKLTDMLMPFEKKMLRRFNTGMLIVLNCRKIM